MSCRINTVMLVRMVNAVMLRIYFSSLFTPVNNAGKDIE